MVSKYGGERFVGAGGRAAVLTALAGGAGGGGEDIFPGEVADAGGTELFDTFVFQVDGANSEKPARPCKIWQVWGKKSNYKTVSLR